VISKNEKKFQALILISCFTILASLFLLASNSSANADILSGLYYERGRVTAVIYESTDPAFRYQALEVTVLSGEFTGLTVEAQNNLMDQTLRAFDVGDRVILMLSESAIQVASPERGPVLLAFVGLFLLLLCLVGGKRGVLSVISLIFSLTTIITILVPLTLAGYSPILLAIIVGILIIFGSITLLAGVNAKSLSAIFGCISGVVFASIFAALAGHFAHISGYHTSNAGMLLAWSPDVSVAGIFISGIIISSIGAITDTSMSIASSMEAIKNANPTISKALLAKAGLNVGRDIMGTMSSTLILAFIGSSFALILFTFSMNTTWIQFINSNEIGVEIIQGVAGSIGIVLAVPITAFIAAILFSQTKTP